MTFEEEDLVPITPVNFFQIHADCRYLGNSNEGGFPFLNKQNARKYLLPDTSTLCSEESFAEVSMGWNEDGLEFYVQINRPFHRVFYPEVSRGDSVEFFIDTRDVKTAGFNTRFCHHFFFLAEGIEGNFAGETTHFRTEDTHPLCDPKELKVKSTLKSSHHILNIFIPTQCLHGYDPQQFDRLGFSYRINQAEGFPQHFSVVTDDFQIDQQPALWSSLKLVKDR